MSTTLKLGNGKSIELELESSSCGYSVTLIAVDGKGNRLSGGNLLGISSEGIALSSFVGEDIHIDKTEGGQLSMIYRFS